MARLLAPAALLAGLGALAACGGQGSGAGANATTGDDAGAGDGGAGASLDDAAGCRLISQGTAGLALRATLLVPAGPLDGEILVDASGKIACVASSCASAAGYGQATRIACDSAVVAPGFVNAHDHTNYDADPPVPHGTTRYQHRNEWRTGADGAMALPSQKSTSSAAALASIELRFVMSGVTSIVGSGGVRGLARNLAAYSDTAQLEGLSGKTVYFDTFPLGDSNGTILTSGCAYPGPISAQSAFSDGVFAPHFAEGINPGAENEIECADSMLGLVTSHTAILHAVGTNAKDVAAIASAGASVVWAPRSNISLYGDTMPVTEMKNAGVPIALGTDWLPTGSMNMLRELECADFVNTKYFAGAFSDADLVQMATANSAKAMGFGDQVGTLAPGMAADLVVFATSGDKSWRTPIEASSEDVALVLRGGKVLYGDAQLVQAASGQACEALTVCNVAKAACIDTPGVKLADALAAAQSSYPLFVCRGQTPANEPSCVPYRDTYPNGTSATDHDGDGVADATDDCPDVFNPPRSMDGGKQSDVDGDGVGDACDAKPLDPSSH